MMNQIKLQLFFQQCTGEGLSIIPVIVENKIFIMTLLIVWAFASPPISGELPLAFINHTSVVDQNTCLW